MGNEHSHDSDSEPESGLDRSVSRGRVVNIRIKSSDTATPAKITAQRLVSYSESDNEGYSAEAKGNRVVNRKNAEAAILSDNESDAESGGESTGVNASPQESSGEQVDEDVEKDGDDAQGSGEDVQVDEEDVERENSSQSPSNSNLSESDNPMEESSSDVNNAEATISDDAEREDTSSVENHDELVEEELGEDVEMGDEYAQTVEDDIEGSEEDVERENPSPSPSTSNSSESENDMEGSSSDINIAEASLCDGESDAEGSNCGTGVNTSKENHDEQVGEDVQMDEDFVQLVNDEIGEAASGGESIGVNASSQESPGEQVDEDVKMDHDYAQMVEDDIEGISERDVKRENPSPTPCSDTGSIVFEGDESEPEDSSSGESIEVNASSQENRDEDGSMSRSQLRLRRKRKINYTEAENEPLHDDQDAQLSQQQPEKDIFDVFSLPNKRIEKIISNPELIEDFEKCKITFRDGTRSAKPSLVKKIFKKCGPQFESIFVDILYDEPFLKRILRHTPSLGKLDYWYHNEEDSLNLLKLLKKLRERNHLVCLHSLKLVGLTGENNLTERHMTILSDLDVRFHSLELGDALWEDVQSATLEKLFERQKATLESLVFHGGFRGDTDKMQTRVLITFPKMEKLENLCICPSYIFVSEIKAPPSKDTRIVSVGVGRKEAYQIAIKFSTDIPTLKQLILGSLIEIKDLNFSTIRRVETFRCGSYWDLPHRLESSVTDLQFPDALKDPSFTVEVAKYFPNLKKVRMFLPSVPVLRAFFKAFENSKLEELYLKTQFDFDSTMEACLLPNMCMRRSLATATLLETLKEYKHFDEYVRYYNLELPIEAHRLMEGHSVGIRALKNLKVLHLEHIPRRLLVPNPKDEKMWYDHNFNFMNSTFGYQNYPLNYQCHKEISQLNNLSECTWKNFEIEGEFMEDLYEAGFVDIPEAQVIKQFQNLSEYTAIDEDFFVPVERGSAALVKIMPSMLCRYLKFEINLIN